MKSNLQSDFISPIRSIRAMYRYARASGKMWWCRMMMRIYFNWKQEEKRIGKSLRAVYLGGKWLHQSALQREKSWWRWERKTEVASRRSRNHDLEIFLAWSLVIWLRSTCTRGEREFSQSRYIWTTVTSRMKERVRGDWCSGSANDLWSEEVDDQPRLRRELKGGRRRNLKHRN